NTWINGGIINQRTYTEMNNRIQEILSLFIEKAEELSATNNLPIPGASSKTDETKMEPLLGSHETIRNLDVAAGPDDSHDMTIRLAILEEAVYSLKKTTEQVKEKLDTVDKILKDVSTQQVNDKEKEEILTNSKLNSEKKLKDEITELEKRYQDIKSNVEDLFVTVTNVDVKLNRFENENKSINVSMNELNEQISSVRTCSHDA
ncbi:unnamed protein product, partial [Lymnaea stagnalis]